MLCVLAPPGRPRTLPDDIQVTIIGTLINPATTANAAAGVAALFSLSKNRCSNFIVMCDEAVKLVNRDAYAQ